MHINLINVGKRFNREWIFRHFSYNFIPGKSYAITGPNGSGKSTLLQVIAGAIMQSEGTIDYIEANQNSSESKSAQIENAYEQISIAAPYLELIEEMTAVEFLAFHYTFKKPVLPTEQIFLQMGLEKSAKKQIRYFSSGMKQRLKLAQAFFTESRVLLLDEPTTNLDTAGTDIYHKLVESYTKDKLVIVCSNDKREYDFCESVIAVNDYK